MQVNLRKTINIPKKPKQAYEKAIEVAKVIYFEVDKLSLKEK